MSPRPLSELEGEWLKLFAVMRRNPASYGIDAGQLAAPFLSVPASRNDGVGGRGTVMLVGKATSGQNTLGCAIVADTYDADTVKRRTPEVLAEVKEGEERSSFLRFAQRLSKEAADAASVVA